MGGQRARSRAGLGWSSGVFFLGSGLGGGNRLPVSPRSAPTRHGANRRQDSWVPTALDSLSPEIPFLYIFKSSFETL